MRIALAALAATVGCVTPLSNRIDVGNEAFVVVVGRGAGGIVDLFAAPAEGGLFRQLTFTRAAEDLPRLGPTGTLLAFVRGGPDGMAAAEPVLLDLITGLETAGPFPTEAGAVTRLGWRPAGDTVVAETERGVWWSGTGDGLRWVAVPAPRRAEAIRWMAEQVGAEGFGTLARCSGGPAWCISTASGETALDSTARDPIRWGPAAIAYLVRDRLEIRPLGGGRIRQPTWAQAPDSLRHPTHHPGTGAAAR